VGGKFDYEGKVPKHSIFLIMCSYTYLKELRISYTSLKKPYFSFFSAGFYIDSSSLKQNN